MTSITWNPVQVKPRNGRPRVITGPDEALNFLDQDWDGAEGEFYHEAKRNCRRALQNIIAPERARQAFVGAFLDAALPIA